MPSGSKKRKAAKKKKEEQANNNNTHLGDLHEEKESDGGETNSPMSQDHNNNQHFAEGEDTSSIQSVTESESVEGVNGNGVSFDQVTVEEKSASQNDREIALEDELEPSTVTIEDIEYEKKSSSSSSSSSSSDDESKFVDKNIEVINWEEEEPVEYAPNGPAVDLEKISDLPEGTRVNEVVLHNLDVVTPDEESHEGVSVESPSSISVKPADVPEIIVVTEAAPAVDDDDFVVAKSKVEVSSPVPETVTQVEPIILSKEEVHLNEDLGLEVNGKSDMGSQSKVDLVSSKATKDEVSSIAIEEEVVSKMLPQSSGPVVDTVNGTEHKKVSEIESLDRQTPVALPPRPVQTTSSLGCCGLFELFTGSNK